MSEDGANRSGREIVDTVDAIPDAQTHLTGQESAEKVFHFAPMLDDLAVSGRASRSGPFSPSRIR